MSPAGERITLPSAKEIDLRAAEWLERRHREDWNEADQTALDAWCAESSAHRIAYIRFEAAWTRAHRLGALRRPQNRGGVLGAASRLPLFAKIAAAVAVLSAAGAGSAIYFKAPPQKVYATAIGERKTLALSDGSKLFQSTFSSLRIALVATGGAARVLARGLMAT